MEVHTIDDYAADCAAGHDIRASVYIEVRQHYRDAGPEHLRPVGETGFVASLAERAEQGAWGGRRLCAGIVGYAAESHESSHRFSFKVATESHESSHPVLS